MDANQKSNLRNEYIFRINKVLDYIDANMNDDLSLDVLSNVANFSSYHFHRIFSSIGSMCGFENQSSFSRAFQMHFGFSASELRKDKSLLESKKSKIDSKNPNTESKKCKTDSKGRKASFDSMTYTSGVENKTIDSYVPNVRPTSIDVKNSHEMTVAYIRVIGSFHGEQDVFQKALLRLMRWAEIRDLIQFPETKILSLYHDNPDITDDDRLRTSLCISVPEHTMVEGEIGKMTIPGGKYAIAHFTLSAMEFKSAWDFIWGEWLPDSGYQPDDRPCFEVYLNNPNEHPEHKSIVDIYIPIKPL